MSETNKVYTFTWKIENFSMRPLPKGESWSSKVFAVNMCGKTRFVLRLFPRGDRYQENDTHASLYFEKEPANNHLDMNYTLTLESTNLSPIVTEGVVIGHTLEGLGLGGFPKFISLSDIYEKKNGFLPNDILTLHFQFSLADENSTGENVIDRSVSPQHLMMKSGICRSSILVHRCSVVWPIENINELAGLQTKFIPVTSIEEGSPSLKLSCDLSNISEIDYVPITICLTSLPPNKGLLFAKGKITVIGAREEYQDSAESTYLFGLELGDVLKFPSFIKTSNLTRDKYLYLCNALFLQCEFAFSYQNDVVSLSEFNRIPLVYEVKEPPKTEFIQSLENIHMHGRYCDVHLHAGGKVFPFYKVVLCARSSVFATMFDHDTKEKNTNEIEITDVEPTTVKRMLDFLVVDAIKEELSPEDACKLYMAADKYDINSLKGRCSILLTSTLSVETVCGVLALADACNDNFLMNAVRSFISAYSTEVFHSAYWKSFQKVHPELSMKMVHQWMEGGPF